MGFELPIHRAPARTQLWSCIACGAIGTAADLCTGACDDRRAQYVRAVEHDAVVAARPALQAWTAEARAVLAGIASAPDGEDAEALWRRWQHDARAVLARRPTPTLTATPAEPVAMWSCATCGRIEAPEPCLGVCIHRPEEFVRADVHAVAAVAARAAQEAAAHVAGPLTRVAWSTPRDGGWPASAAAVRDQARAALG